MIIYFLWRWILNVENFRSDNLIFLCCVYYSYVGDVDFKLVVKGIVVGIEDF